MTLLPSLLRTFSGAALPPLMRRWAAATTAGEFAGFCIPAVAGAACYALSGSPERPAVALTYWGVLVSAGAGEGAMLATAQARVLCDRFPALGKGAWVRATAAGGAAGWALGMLPSTVDAFLKLPPWGMALAWALLAVPLLCTIGVAQWLVLRDYVTNGSSWITANVLGWLVGLPATFIAPALVPNGSAPAVWLAAFVTAGLVMAAAVGVVTSRAFVRLDPSETA